MAVVQESTGCIFTQCFLGTQKSIEYTRVGMWSGLEEVGPALRIFSFVPLKLDSKELHSLAQWALEWHARYTGLKFKFYSVEPINDFTWLKWYRVRPRGERMKLKVV